MPPDLGSCWLRRRHREGRRPTWKPGRPDARFAGQWNADKPAKVMEKVTGGGGRPWWRLGPPDGGDQAAPWSPARGLGLAVRSGTTGRPPGGISRGPIGGAWNGGSWLAYA